jgi:hypothetical protein
MYDTGALKKLLGGQPGGRKRKTYVKVEGWCQIGIEEYECKKIENKNTRGNRIGVSREGGGGRQCQI